MAPRWDISVEQLIVDIIAVIIAIAAGVLAWWSWSASERANTIARDANAIAQKALDSQISPAQLSVAVGDPTWTIEGPRGSRPVVLSLIAPITVTNDGMQQGCISDMLAFVKLPVTNEQRQLRALYFVDPERVLTTLQRRAPIYEAHRARFGPIVVLGKQQVSETVVLQSTSVGRADLRDGLYTVILYAAECASAEQWHQQWTSTYLFTTDDLAEFLKGVPTSQESEERRRAVRALRTQ